NGDHHGLDQELTNDVPLLGANGAANADFAGSFQHGRQHDVHDADAADQQRDAGDRDHDDLKHALLLLALREQTSGYRDRKVAGVVVPGGDDGADDLGHFDGIGVGVDAHEDAVDFVFEVTVVVLEAAHDCV